MGLEYARGHGDVGGSLNAGVNRCFPKQTYPNASRKTVRGSR
jgi:hypothetical protein